MERLSLENIERFIVLNNELVIEDPYTLKITKDEFLKNYMEKLKLGHIDIFILKNEKEDIGFVELSKDVDTVIIEEIYVKEHYRNYNVYKSMLEFIHVHCNDANIRKVKFRGVNDKVDLIKALKASHYRMEKEHIQMEKTIVELSKRNLQIPISYKTFNEIGDGKWIYNFIKECMEGSDFNYKVEEINELTQINNDLIFVLYENNQPIGFIISHINEKRNKQQNVNVIYIEEIAILKDFRNKGYGLKVIQFVLNKGKNKGMDIARLHVYRHNEKAYRLYKKIGFNEIKGIGYWTKNLK